MQDAQQAADENQADFADGPDMIFGVFQSVGEDLGVDPFYLRVAFLVGLFFSPLAVIAAYVALGAVVALSHWLFPKPRPSAEPCEQAEVTVEPQRLAA